MTAVPPQRFKPERLDRWSTVVTWLALAGAGMVLAAVDRAAPAVGMGPAYIPLIGLAGWRLGLRSSIAVALVAALANIPPQHAAEASGSPAVAMARAILRLCTYAFVVGAVHALRRLYDRERMAARRDHLTGASNRAAFEERAVAVLTGRVRRAAVALALIDVDAFKLINDARGHAAGDDVLRTLVRSCTAGMQGDDCLGRLGGDEFALLLGAPTAADALERVGVVHRMLREGMAAPDVGATVSMGACILAVGATAGPSTAMLEADRLLYAAKSAGPGKLRTGTFGSAWPSPGVPAFDGRHPPAIAGGMG